MDNAKQHWKILQKLENNLANRVNEFLVVGYEGEGAIVVTEDGDGYWIGKMEFGWGEKKTAAKPTPLDVPGLVQMAECHGHILLLNKRGQIYSMGRNGHGQLGLGYGKRKTYFLPQLISIPHKFISVRCCYDYSLALTEDGKVWAWGWNNFGQVGVDSSTEQVLSPRQISELDPHRIVAVECGGHHSLALTDQGEVYAWGWNESGQLGYISEPSTHTTAQIPTPSPIKSMAAGYYHTLLLTQTGEVYACGDNRHGQLGLPTTTRFSLRLSKVEGLPLISQIASHFRINLSIAMSSDQRCFVWGGLRDKTIITTPRKLPPVYSTVESPLSFYSTFRSTPHSVSIPVTPQNRLSTRMSRMFDNPKTSDVQFVVEQRTIYAHRIILSNSSDYFARMFSERWVVPVDPKNPIVKVTIPDHSYQVFHALLHFLYTDSLEIPPDLLSELFDLTSNPARKNLLSGSCPAIYSQTIWSD